MNVFGSGSSGLIGSEIVEFFDRRARRVVGIVERLTGKAMRWEYREAAREGDPICYRSDRSKMQGHYPNWSVTRSLDDVIGEIVRDGHDRLPAGNPP
jgi:UDP-glucose 4-epimerase